jgi:hypothetical protein
MGTPWDLSSLEKTDSRWLGNSRLHQSNQAVIDNENTKTALTMAAMMAWDVNSL